MAKHNELPKISIRAGNVLRTRSLAVYDQDGGNTRFQIAAPRSGKKCELDIVVMMLGTAPSGVPLDQKDMDNRFHAIGWRKMTTEEYEAWAKSQGLEVRPKKKSSTPDTEKP